MLAAYRSGRLAHAWLIGGPKGIGKATLAWRMARFVLAHPDPDPPGGPGRERPFRRPRPARPARLIDGAGASGLCACPRANGGRRRRLLRPRIRVESVRKAMQVFQFAPAFGGWRVCIVDSRRRPQPQQRQRASEGHRGAARPLAVPYRRASARTGAADDPVALPASCASTGSLKARSSKWCVGLARPGAKRADKAIASAAARSRRFGPGGARPAFA